MYTDESVLVTTGDDDYRYVSTQDTIDPTRPMVSTSENSTRRQELQRRKRSLIRGALPTGCQYVFADGSRDARDQMELAINKKFFELQEAGVKDFKIKLNITKIVFNGLKNISASGLAEMHLAINDPPENGTCTIKTASIEESSGKEVWQPAATGYALIDEFKIQCTNWVDPNGHTITKYVFKVRTQKERGERTTLLYSGPLPEAKVIFGVGNFHLFVEIYEEAGAFAEYIIDNRFQVLIPDESDMPPIDAMLEQYSKAGNQARVSQIIQAAASIRSNACWTNVACALKAQGQQIDSYDSNDMTPSQKETLDGIVRDISHQNTLLLESAKDYLQFTNADQLEQAGDTLSSITSDLVSSGPMSKTLDMKGRDAAVGMVEKMSEGFKTIDVPDPNKLQAFMEGTIGAVGAILQGLSSILYSNDPNEIPLTDFEAAADLPYDTEILTGDDADIPEDPDDALRKNAMRLIRIKAVEQVKKMTALVEEIAETVLKNSVLGETMRSKSPMGAQMIIHKIYGSDLPGRDINGDGVKDIPLRYEFDDSKTVVQFPLGFCPNSPGFVQNDTRQLCRGQWGVVLKEWETITASYPASAQRLNYVTKQVEVDLYDGVGNKVHVQRMVNPISFVIERLADKKPELVELPDDQIVHVHVQSRLETLNMRSKAPIIYHKMTLSTAYATVNVHLLVNDPLEAQIVIIASHARMPTVDRCDFIKVAAAIEDFDGNFLDWFITKEEVNNRTGDWYFGVLSVATPSGKNVTEIIEDRVPCSESGLTRSLLGWVWGIDRYSFRTYSSGFYYFDTTIESWDGDGVSVLNTSRLVTAATCDHLTSFATGFFPVPNTLDFEFIFAQDGFEDNMTVFMLLILSIITYLVGMIWAAKKDKVDVKKVGTRGGGRGKIRQLGYSSLESC
jgi:hypothetical protein